MSESGTSNRIRSYKNVGLDADEMRRRREDEGVQLRKQKREEEVLKRRNVPTSEQTMDDESEASNQQSLANTAGAAGELSNQFLEETLRDLHSTVTDAQIAAAQRLRKVLSREPNPPIDIVVQFGVIPRLVEFLQRYDTPALQFEAAWALTNVASGTSEQTRIVAQHDAIRHFVEVIRRSSSEDVQEQAIWALGNIAGDSPELRDAVIQSGIVEVFFDMLNTRLFGGRLTNPVGSAPVVPPEAPIRVSLLRNICWCASNICRGKAPPPDFSRLRCLIAPLVGILFESVDADVLTDASWALAHLSDGPAEKIQALVDSGAVRRLVELLLHPSVSVQTAALRAVGNVVTGDDVQTQVVINCNVLPALHTLIKTGSKGSIRKEACWAVSNIAAGNRSQIQALIDANLLPTLVETVRSAEFRTRKEATWAITNVTSGGSREQVRYALETGIIPAICEMLSVHDPRVLLVALSGIENILRSGEQERERLAKSMNSLANATQQPVNPYCVLVEECGGLEKLEFLQTHSNNEVYQKTYNIIEKYFGGTEPDNETVMKTDIAAAGVSGQPLVNMVADASQIQPGQFSF